jgi:MFS family permease
VTADPSWQTGSNSVSGSVSGVVHTPRPHRPADHRPAEHPPSDQRPSAHGLRGLIGVRGLRTLIGVRSFSSFGDGAFQGALASLVLFDPSSQSSPGTIAAAVTVLLLPYSIIGPFAGALLDRWSRRQVILWANVLRSVAIAVLAALLAVGIPTSVLLIIALVVTGAGRFVGSGLSAALPHVIAQDSLVGANSLTTTIGSVATAVGGGYALGLKSLLGSGNGGVALVTATVIVFYVTAALLVLRFPAPALGPDETDEPPQPLLAVLQGFAAGFRHVLQRPTVAVNIAMVVLVRFCFGMATLVVLLLFRHHFTDTHGIFKGGTAGITEVLGLAALGVFLGAVVTAPMVAWLGRTRYAAGLLSVAALVVVASGLQFTQLSTMIATFVIAFAYQSSKICADTVVQSDSDDAHIGRVFALYDTASNIFYVAGFVLGVALVPDDGLSSPAVILVGVVFVLTSAVYGMSMRRCHGSWSGSPC